MKAFLDLFRRNWGLKLLSLVLAIVTYFSVRDSIRSGHTRTERNPAVNPGGTFLKGPAN